MQPRPAKACNQPHDLLFVPSKKGMSQRGTQIQWHDPYFMTCTRTGFLIDGALEQS